MQPSNSATTILFFILFGPLLLLQLCSAAKPALDVRPFSPSDLMSLKRVSSPSVNPSGTFAVVSVYRYFVANNTFTRNLHLVDLSSTSTKPLTPAQLGVSDSNPVWLSNSIIAFTSTRKTGSGNLFYVSIADSSKYGKIFPLFSNNSAFAASASNLKAHPQSSQLAFTSLVQIKSSLSSAASSFDSGVVYDKLFTRHWDEWLSPNTLSQLFILKYKIDVKQGERVSIVAAPINLLKDTLLESPVPPHGDESHFEFSPDGNEIAFSSRVPEGSAMAWNTNLDIYVVSTSGNMTPQVISDDNQGTDCTPSYSPDSKYISWLSMRTPGFEADINRIIVMERNTSDYFILTSSWDRSVESIVWSPDSKSLYVTAQEFGHHKIFKIKLSNGHISEIVKNGGNSALSFVIDGPGVGSLIFLRSTPVLAPEVFSVNLNDADGDGVEPPTRRNTMDPVQLSRFNYETLLSTLMSEPEEFWFNGFNDEPVMGWLFKPSKFSIKETYPLAFLVHGGPESAWNADFSFRWNPQVYAGAGYAVVAINFHGSTGYGDKFTRSILQNWGGAPFEDLMLGLDFVLEKNSFIDKDRICALGASYGGYMVNWLNGHTDRFSCIVNHDGIFDTFGDYFATDELWFPEFEMGGTPWESHARKNYKKWNPASFVQKWNTPSLVIHGEKDYRLPVTEGLSTFTALQRQGIPSKFLYFPDENHWVLKPANVLRWYKEILDWIGKWTASDEMASEGVKLWKAARRVMKRATSETKSYEVQSQTQLLDL